MSNLFTLILCSTSLCAVESNVDDDLFTAITPHLAQMQNPNDVHFNAKGYASGECYAARDAGNRFLWRSGVFGSGAVGMRPRRYRPWRLVEIGCVGMLLRRCVVSQDDRAKATASGRPDHARPRESCCHGGSPRQWPGSRHPSRAALDVGHHKTGKARGKPHRDSGLQHARQPLRDHPHPLPRRPDLRPVGPGDPGNNTFQVNEPLSWA